MKSTFSFHLLTGRPETISLFLKGAIAINAVLRASYVVGMLIKNIKNSLKKGIGNNYASLSPNKNNAFSLSIAGANSCLELGNLPISSKKATFPFRHIGLGQNIFLHNNTNPKDISSRSWT